MKKKLSKSEQEYYAQYREYRILMWITAIMEIVIGGEFLVDIFIQINK